MTGRGMELRKRVWAVLACLVMLAVTLGIGVRADRDAGRNGVDITLNFAVNNKMGVGVVACAGLLRVREAPSGSAYIVAELRAGHEVIVLAEEAGFYRIIAEVGEYTEAYTEEYSEIIRGYVKMEYIEIMR